MEGAGYEPVRLGIPLDPHGSVLAASQCSFFVGVCSGMAQLCYSVGIPSVILRYKQTRVEMKRWHTGKAVGISLGLEHFRQVFLSGLSSWKATYGAVQEQVGSTVHQPAH
jgi:hypothetical protein